MKPSKLSIVRISVSLSLSIVVITAVTGWARSRSLDSHAVMIMLKDQNLQTSGAQARARVEQELRSSHATDVRLFKAVNVIHAQVSDEELSRLKVNPDVQKVVNVNPVVKKPKARKSAITTTTKTLFERFVGVVRDAVAPAAPPQQAAGGLTPLVVPGACYPDGKVMLEPEALQVMHINSDDPTMQTARGLGFTGSGVRVAVIADGVDPQNVNFIRADGRTSVVEYVDFSGDGVTAVASGGEAFLDHNSIGGQGLHTYDVSGFSAQTLPSACNVRIEGAAPGADMIALKAFSATVLTTSATQLTALDYAISEGNNDIINESFGGNVLPDVESSDILELLNAEAVKRGIVVVTASGDSGPSNTVGNPGITSPQVINAGASTTFRFFAQTNMGNTRYFATGWLNDNVSALSSGGFGQTGRTVDLLAPGDSSFVSCDASANFQECTNLLNKPFDVTLGGGTSQAAPLTAGTAAMMIEAYRQAHGGAKPSPALVKEILTSTAMDLSTSAVEQGSGLVNAYKAVLLASVVNGGHPTSAAVINALKNPGIGGLPILISQGQLYGSGLPGKNASWKVTISNPASTSQRVQIAGHKLGDSQSIGSGTVNFSDTTSQKLTSPAGDPKNFEKITFTVPAGADHLSVSFAYVGTKGVAALTLFDPSGHMAAYSDPQGVGNHGMVEVRVPAAGVWTGVFASLLQAKGGVSSPVPWEASVQSFVPFGSVDSSSFVLNGGASRTVNLSAPISTSSGDSSGTFVVQSSLSGSDKDVGGRQRSAIAVTLRSLVDVQNGGKIQGTFTGGIGRDPAHAQTNFYQFNVGAGHESITADLSMQTDAKDIVEMLLIDPAGNTVATGKNIIGTNQELVASATALNPMAGLWTLVIDLGDPVAGDKISQDFTAQISLDRAVLQSSNLPNDEQVTLASGSKNTYTVRITNTTQSPQAYFVDARTPTLTFMPLLVQGPTSQPDPNATPAPAPAAVVTTVASYQFPLGIKDIPPSFLVPTHSASVQFEADASSAVALAYSAAFGDPSLMTISSQADAGGVFQAVATYEPSRGLVTRGLWGAAPGPTGGAAGALAAGTVKVSSIVQTLGFDATVTSTTGDYWLQATFSNAPNLSPVVLQPGESANLQIAISPSGMPGAVVQGTLYIDEYVAGGNPDGVDGANDVAEVPYKYTIE
jgi:hypothetical protein